ncbi:HNH endonuclease family protein [Streptomyces chitinivorans]|uniref:HNH endonuclease family protein n=1 Tax=Streptomyces chitinivorans TaxID=1257027 RepID=A0ABW7HU82_9ACTN|nr:DUF262 domain-containing protein [Streptomyces chitinivorans]MDH2408278.1 DUF262 domain-containing protein [Streptomyces chitinivorans]
MATHMVNLDALIPREDFESISPGGDAQPSAIQNSIRVTDLTLEGFAYPVLRKPDFQRETANWTPEKVTALVRSYLEGDLIPAIILWRSTMSGKVFVIDGAHRLSALIAWAHDDYGDRHTSLRFFDNIIPDEQRKAAEATRQLIQESVGSFSDLSLALKNPDTVSDQRLRLARNLSFLSLPLQWVPGEADKAESSFYRINQQATAIDPTELDMIKARRKPNALAARAFIRAGTGHKYWSSFSESVQADIESIAKEVYDLIFRPNLDLSIKSADLPVAGRGYSADSVKMVFELVNFVNGVQPEMWREETGSRRRKGSNEEAVTPLTDDSDGSATLKFMRAVKKAAERIAGKTPASLGLHPAVYFYSYTGRFQPAAFLAAIAFVQELVNKRMLVKFSENRDAFEDFLVKHKYFLNQIVRRYGSLQRSAAPIQQMYRIVLKGLIEGVSVDGIISRLQDPDTARLPVKVITAGDHEYGRDFSTRTKNAVYLETALQTSPRCNICGARLHTRFSTVDHKIRKEDGGTGAPGNAQLVHPYCNSGYKEYLHASRR